jgi:hypothetical protein
VKMLAATTLLLIISACAQATAPDATAKEASVTSDSMTVLGTLTSEGVECQAMREDKTNLLYTLTGNLGAFKAGDPVTVTGRIAEMSKCMQGKTIVVKTITARDR